MKKKPYLVIPRDGITRAFTYEYPTHNTHAHTYTYTTYNIYRNTPRAIFMYISGTRGESLAREIIYDRMER